MLQGIKSKKVILLRHLSVAVFSFLLVYLFYLSYYTWGVTPSLWPDWGMDHPFWRAWAHAAFILLFLTLILSPAAKLYHPVKKFITWRREFGIWFAILSLGHGYAIWDRWARWDVARLFGFEYIEEVGGYILFRPEVGIMNMMGIVIAPMIILLAITSFDKAVKILGVSSWKWLHLSIINVIFYIVMLRGVLYLFYFFQFSPPNWREYPSIWFLYVFLGMAVIVVLLQAAAFVKTLLQKRNGKEKKSVLQVAFIMSVVIMFIMPILLLLGTVAYFDNRSIKEAPLSMGQASPHYYVINHEESYNINTYAQAD